MTIVGNAAISLQPQPCLECGDSPATYDCDVVVFKLTGSGKAVLDKGSYKTVGSIKIKKGALALVGELCETTGACCYDGGFFFATVKAGKKTFAVGAPVELAVWSIFGKDLDKTRTMQVKQGKKIKLDSAIFLTAADVYDDEDDDVNLETFSLAAAAFGKVQAAVTKDKQGNSSWCNKVNIEGCELIYTPKSYSGWFVGTYPCVNDEDCFLCDCTDTDIFGGTWKASYQSKYTTVTGAMTVAGVSFDVE